MYKIFITKDVETKRDLNERGVNDINHKKEGQGKYK